jgi:magnesium transporter
MTERKIPLSQVQFLLDESRIYAEEVLRRQLESYNPIDLAEVLKDLEDEGKVRLFLSLGPEARALVLDETDAESRETILASLDVPAISDVVEEMPPDEGADILQQLPEEKGQEVLGEVEQDLAEELSELTRYGKDTAGGMMTTDFVEVDVAATVGEALQKVREEEEAEHVSEVYALDARGRLRGTVDIKTLLERPPDERVSVAMTSDPLSVALDTDQEDVANLVNKYNLPALPVVDVEHVMKGVITLDDVLDVIDEEVDEDMLRIAGTLSRDLVSVPIRKKYVNRLPFLFTTFVGGILTIVIQYSFRFTTDQLVAITFFIPIINGLAGNVGLQSSTIMVRGFATGEIGLDRIHKLLPIEATTGALIGLTFGVLCGVVTAVFAGALNSTALLGVVVGVSLAAATTMASVIGTAVPAFCERVGIDPAVSAGPFIVTLLDTAALLVYLGFATALLQFLVR